MLWSKGFVCVATGIHKSYIFVYGKYMKLRHDDICNVPIVLKELGKCS
jgi:hypothetical protein